MKSSIVSSSVHSMRTDILSMYSFLVMRFIFILPFKIRSFYKNDYIQKNSSEATGIFTVVTTKRNTDAV